MQIIQTQKCLFDVHISIIKRNVGAPVHTHTHTVIHRNYVCRLIFVQRQLWKKKKSAGDTNLNQTCWISDALCSPRSPRRHVFLVLLNISQRRSRRPRPDSGVNYSCLLFFNHSWTSGPCASLYQELLRLLHIAFFLSASIFRSHCGWNGGTELQIMPIACKALVHQASGYIPGLLTRSLLTDCSTMKHSI